MSHHESAPQPDPHETHIIGAQHPAEALIIETETTGDEASFVVHAEEPDMHITGSTDITDPTVLAALMFEVGEGIQAGRREVRRRQQESEEQ